MLQIKLSHFHEATRAAEKILVVDLGFLGDTLHLIPALWEIKRHYPGAELHMISAPLGAEVLRLAPCVDCVWPLELDPAKLVKPCANNGRSFARYAGNASTYPSILAAMIAPRFSPG